MKQDEKPPSCNLNMKKDITRPGSSSDAVIALYPIKDCQGSTAILAIDNKNRYIFNTNGPGWGFPFGFCYGYGTESKGKSNRYILEDGY